MPRPFRLHCTVYNLWHMQLHCLCLAFRSRVRSQPPATFGGEPLVFDFCSSYIAICLSTARCLEKVENHRQIRLFSVATTQIFHKILLLQIADYQRPGYVVSPRAVPARSVWSKKTVRHYTRKLMSSQLRVYQTKLQGVVKKQNKNALSHTISMQNPSVQIDQLYISIDSFWSELMELCVAGKRHDCLEYSTK